MIIPRIFPPYWDWRRVAELLITVYQTIVGVVFWVWPSSLMLHVYDPMREIMPAKGWALLLWIVCLGHAIAIYLNGKIPGISMPIRLTSSIIHLLIIAFIGWCFMKVGAYWPVTTMTLLAILVIGSMATAMEDCVVRYGNGNSRA